MAKRFSGSIGSSVWSLNHSGASPVYDALGPVPGGAVLTGVDVLYSVDLAQDVMWGFALSGSGNGTQAGFESGVSLIRSMGNKPLSRIVHPCFYLAMSADAPMSFSLGLRVAVGRGGAWVIVVSDTLSGVVRSGLITVRWGVPGILGRAFGIVGGGGGNGNGNGNGNGEPPPPKPLP
jgi:hypothetical protein